MCFIVFVNCNMYPIDKTLQCYCLCSVIDLINKIINVLLYPNVDKNPVHKMLSKLLC